MIEIGDVKDSDAAKPFGTHRIAHALPAAIEPATRLFNRHEQKILVQGDITLTTRANHRGAKRRARGIGDIPHLQSVEPTLEDVVADKPEVTVEESKTSRILRIAEVCQPVDVTDQFEIARSCGRIL